MTRVLIVRDGTDRGGSLSFDLRDLLETIGEDATKSLWRAPGVNYVSSDEREIPVMESLGRGEEVQGDDLRGGISRLLQVVDGDFEAFLDNEESPWLILRAVDSSWWEIVCYREVVRNAVKRRFDLVEERTTA